MIYVLTKSEFFLNLEYSFGETQLCLVRASRTREKKHRKSVIKIKSA